jgi:hypothetical protein
LRLRRYLSGRPFVLSFSAGSEDVFAGARRAGHQLTQITAGRVRLDRLNVVASTYRLFGTLWSAGPDHSNRD